jgi:O-antigen/teichoic acid export membrane protein
VNGGTVSLRRGVAYVLVGNGFFNACRLIAVPILLAKFTSDAILGQYETGMALAAPFILLCSLELRSVLVSDTAGRFALQTYEALRSASLAIAALGVLVLITLTTGVGASFSMAAVLLGACALRLVYQYAELYWGVYQKRERLDRLAISNALRGAAMIAAFGIAVPLVASLVRGQGHPAERLADGAAIAVWITVAGWALIAWFLDRRRARQESTGSGRPTGTDVLALAKLALPLGIVAALISLCENVPRWFIRADAEGLRALGQFAAVAYIPMAAHFVVLQIALAASNRLAQRFRDDRGGFLRLGFALIGVSLVLGAGVFLTVWLIGPAILRVAYRPEYEAHYAAFLVLVAGQCVILPASVLGYILTQMRIFWSQVLIHCLVLAGTVGVAWRLIPDEPIAGGARTMLIRAAIQTVLYAVCFAAAMHLRPPGRSSFGAVN